jgi:hypothetical protein
MYEEGKPNGLIKANSKNAIIFLEDNEISDVKLSGNQLTEYYPKNLVEKRKRNFQLPKFNLLENRPKKEMMYEKLSKFKWHTH